MGTIRESALGSQTSDDKKFYDCPGDGVKCLFDDINKVIVTETRNSLSLENQWFNYFYKIESYPN